MAVVENIGATLKKARLEKSITLEEVESETRIRKHYLEALENENWDYIPGNVYLRGFMRTYARYLGLNEAEYLDALSSLIAPSTPDLPTDNLRTPIELPGKPKNKLAILLAIAAILVLFVSQFVYRNFIADPRSNSNDNTNAAGSSTVESVQTAESPLAETPIVEENTSITLKIKVLRSKCWMEIKSEGALLYEGTLQAGEEKQFTGLQQVSFRLGNVGDTEVSVNNSVLEGLGESGEVVYKEYVIINDEPTEIIP